LGDGFSNLQFLGNTPCFKDVETRVLITGASVWQTDFSGVMLISVVDLFFRPLTISIILSIYTVRPPFTGLLELGEGRSIVNGRAL
jgi:hypothetical protein